MTTEEKSLLLSARGDLYHQGVITKLFPSNNTGVVRIESGRELTFSYELVVLSGEVNSPLELKVGDPVGYDLGWTSNGLRITKLKSYRRLSSGDEQPSSEGERGERQDLPPKNFSDENS